MKWIKYKDQGVVNPANVNYIKHIEETNKGHIRFYFNKDRSITWTFDDKTEALSVYTSLMKYLMNINYLTDLSFVE